MFWTGCWNIEISEKTLLGNVALYADADMNYFLQIMNCLAWIILVLTTVLMPVQLFKDLYMCLNSANLLNEAATQIENMTPRIEEANNILLLNMIGSFRQTRCHGGWTNSCYSSREHTQCTLGTTDQYKQQIPALHKQSEKMESAGSSGRKQMGNYYECIF